MKHNFCALLSRLQELDKTVEGRKKLTRHQKTMLSIPWIWRTGPHHSVQPRKSRRYVKGWWAQLRKAELRRAQILRGGGSSEEIT